MKTKVKKYPLLISLIVSCVLVVTSLFILGFFGMNLGTSLGGGSQMEIIISDDADANKCVEKIKKCFSVNDYTVDSAFVEDKFIAGENNTEMSKKVIVVKVAKSDISDKSEKYIRYAIADSLDIDINNISTLENITSVVKAKNVLFLGIAVGIIAVCLFVMGWIRYDIFAGLSFILSYLHNIILYLSLLILTRVQLNLISLGAMLVLTLIMSALLIQIYEKNREEKKLQTNEKLSATERMIASEKQVVKPYLFVGIAIVVFAALLVFVPVNAVRFTSLNILIATLVTAYTSFIVGPGSYSYLLEVSEFNKKAVLSRNDTVNKAIKKKIKKNTAKKEVASK